MTDLPEDVSKWPRDPFDLLGVGRDSDTKTARRAYFKLIRKYKPDKFPDAFQKIHEAHESVSRMLQWRQSRAADEEAAEPIPVAQFFDNEATTSSNESSKVDLETNSFLGSLDDVAAAAFQAEDPFAALQRNLTAGNFQQAIHTINRLDKNSFPQYEHRANLTRYYLAKFFPKSLATPKASENKKKEQTAELAAQKRMVLLLKSLGGELDDPAIERLTEEFDARPQLAVSKPVNRFLNQCRNFHLMLQVCRLRWRAIGHSKPQVVIDDIRCLQPHSLMSSESWPGILAESMEFTVWRTGAVYRQHNEASWQEIAESKNDWIADDIETLILASEQYHNMANEHEWLSVVPFSRSMLPNQRKSKWRPVVQQLANDDCNVLVALTGVHKKAALVLNAFEQGLRNLFNELHPDETVQTIDGLRDGVACFMQQVVARGYAYSRYEIARFCGLNQIDPIDLARVASTFHDDSASHDGTSWVETIRRDTPLLCVYYVHRLAASMGLAKF